MSQNTVIISIQIVMTSNTQSPAWTDAVESLKDNEIRPESTRYFVAAKSEISNHDLFVIPIRLTRQPQSPDLLSQRLRPL
jgi:hypothetical protein